MDLRYAKRPTNLLGRVSYSGLFGQQSWKDTRFTSENYHEYVKHVVYFLMKGFKGHGEGDILDIRIKIVRHPESWVRGSIRENHFRIKIDRTNLEGRRFVTDVEVHDCILEDLQISRDNALEAATQLFDSTASDLQTQRSYPDYVKELEGILTNVEMKVAKEKFPDHSSEEALDALRQYYVKLQEDDEKRMQQERKRRIAYADQCSRGMHCDCDPKINKFPVGGCSICGGYNCC